MSRIGFVRRTATVLMAMVGLLTGLLTAASPPAAAAIDIGTSCPGSAALADFDDLEGVPTAAVDAIGCIAGYGIATGTAPSTFDPFTQVPRWQMALFLSRQLAAHGVVSTPLIGSQHSFTDLDGVPAAARAAIAQIAALGISTGTTQTTFDPSAKVERWEMALFIARLIDVVNSDASGLPPTVGQGFTDLVGVPDAGETAINQITLLGVAEGTSSLTFDPFGTIERWQMALFLARTLAVEGVVDTAPFLVDARIVDSDSSGSVTAGDIVSLTFNEAMDTSIPEKADLTLSDGVTRAPLDQQLPNVAWAWDGTGTVLTGVVTADTSGPVRLPAVIVDASGDRFTDLYDLDGKQLDLIRGDSVLDHSSG